MPVSCFSAHLSDIIRFGVSARRQPPVCADSDSARASEGGPPRQAAMSKRFGDLEHQGARVAAMLPTRSSAFLSSAIAALTMAATFTAAAADGLQPHRHPNLLERIMEPIVREVEISRMVGPEKRSFPDANDSLLNKIKLQHVLMPDITNSAAASNSAHRSKKEVDKGSEINRDQLTGKGKEGLELTVGARARQSLQSSDISEPSYALSYVGQDATGFDAMKFFWNNFIAAPPVENPDFVPRSSAAASGLPSVIRLEEKVKSVVSESNDSSSGENVNATDIKPVAELISVEFEMFVFPNPASIATKQNATEVGSAGGMHLPGGRRPLLQLPANRSAYLMVDAFPAQYGVVNAAITRTSPLLQEKTPTSPSKNCNKITLLASILVVICSICCVLASALPFILKKRVRMPGSTVWVTTSGKKIVRPPGAPINASSVLPVKLVTASLQQA